MPEFQLLPGAKGLDFPEGVTLRPDARGRLKVNDTVAARIRGSAAFRRYDTMVEVAPARFHAELDAFACECGFSPWPWQNDCPRCGRHWER